MGLDICTAPSDYSPIYAGRQVGGFIDIGQADLPRKSAGLGGRHAQPCRCRGEYVDWNDQNFAATGLREYNDLRSIMPAISFRPTQQTVLRLNYRIQSSRDITGNTIGATVGPTRGLSFGIATYF